MSELFVVPENVVHSIVDIGMPSEKAFRVYLGISVDELAGTTRIAAGRIEDIENGATPTDDEVDALAEALDVPADLLIDE